MKHTDVLALPVEVDSSYEYCSVIWIVLVTNKITEVFWRTTFKPFGVCPSKHLALHNHHCTFIWFIDSIGHPAHAGGR